MMDPPYEELAEVDHSHVSTIEWRHGTAYCENLHNTCISVVVAAGDAIYRRVMTLLGVVTQAAAAAV